MSEAYSVSIGVSATGVEEAISNLQRLDELLNQINGKSVSVSVQLAEDVINRVSDVKDAINIYNYYFQNYKYQEIIKKDDTLVELKIKNDPKTVKKIKAKEPILLYLPNDYDKNEIKINYNGIEKLNYGMKKDTKIGYIDISYKNKIYKKVDVVLDEDVNFSLINFIKNNIITISIFIIILLFVIKMY